MNISFDLKRYDIAHGMAPLGHKPPFSLQSVLFLDFMLFLEKVEDDHSEKDDDEDCEGTADVNPSQVKWLLNYIKLYFHETIPSLINPLKLCHIDVRPLVLVPKVHLKVAISTLRMHNCQKDRVRETNFENL